MLEKRCARCGKTKPINEYFKNKARSDGVSGYCKICQQEANAVHQRDQRQQVLDALGGARCVADGCEWTDVRALTVDHIDGGGTQHRIDAVSTWGVFKHVLAHPDEYQVLCWNHNQIKRYENGEFGAEYNARVKKNPREVLTRPVRWSRDFDACTKCGDTERPHKGKGLCTACFMQEWRTTT